MTSLRIEGARVVCPASGLDDVTDVTLQGGRIGYVGSGGPACDETVDGRGQLLLPGAICLDTQLSDPGREDNETLAQTLARAAQGGITTVLGHAPGPPAPSDAPGVRELLSRAETLPGARLLMAGHVSVHGEGRALADMGEMQRAGAVAVTDLCQARLSRSILRPAMEYAGSFGLLFVTSPLDVALAGKAIATEGPVSTALGLPASPAEAEVVGAVMAIECARRARTRVHLAGLTTRAALARVRAAQDEGVAVTASCPIAHLLLDESEHLRRRFDPALRLLPPLRAAEDRHALIAAAQEGAVCVSSQHRAWGPVDKDVEFERAAPGGPTLRVALPLLLDEVGAGAAARAMSLLPAQALGLTDRGKITEGARADVVLLSSGEPGVGGTGHEARARRHCALGPMSPRHRVTACFVDGRRVPDFTDGGRTVR